MSKQEKLQACYIEISKIITDMESGGDINADTTARFTKIIAELGIIYDSETKSQIDLFLSQAQERIDNISHNIGQNIKEVHRSDQLNTLKNVAHSAYIKGKYL